MLMTGCKVRRDPSTKEQPSIDLSRHYGPIGIKAVVAATIFKPSLRVNDGHANSSTDQDRQHQSGD